MKKNKDIELEESLLKNFLYNNNIPDSNNCTEVLVTDANEFPISDFSKHVAKFVRANHVQTDKHWRENWSKNEF